eukprot:9199493-Ditylum_brightwellii.AAC.1
MKFSAAIVGFFPLISSTSVLLTLLLLFIQAFQAAIADKFHATKDYIGNTMWVFGADGIFVYSPD